MKNLFGVLILGVILFCSPKPVEQKESTPERISFPRKGGITVPFTENQGQLAEEVLFYAQIAQGIVYENNSDYFRSVLYRKISMYWYVG